MEALKTRIDSVKEDAAKFDFRESLEYLPPLHRAVVDNDLSAMEGLMRKGEDPDDDDKTRFGFSAVHWAAMVGDGGVLELLDKYGANMSAVDECDLTPLHVAALSGNQKALIWLLDNTHDINSREEYEQTPLHQAALNGNLDSAKLLVERGASLEAEDMFVLTPLSIAVVRGFSLLVKFFLKQGANPAVYDVQQKSLLHMAAITDNTLVMKWLMEKGNAVDARDTLKSTPLHDAAKNGSSKAIKLLLEHGADIKAINEKGYTALELAKINGHAKAVKLLLECGEMNNCPQEKNSCPCEDIIEKKDVCFMEEPPRANQILRETSSTVEDNTRSDDARFMEVSDRKLSDSDKINLKDPAKDINTEKVCSPGKNNITNKDTCSMGECNLTEDNTHSPESLSSCIRSDFEMEYAEGKDGKDIEHSITSRDAKYMFDQNCSKILEVIPIEIIHVDPEGYETSKDIVEEDCSREDSEEESSSDSHSLPDISPNKLTFEHIKSIIF